MTWPPAFGRVCQIGVCLMHGTPARKAADGTRRSAANEAMQPFATSDSLHCRWFRIQHRCRSDDWCWTDGCRRSWDWCLVPPQCVYGQFHVARRFIRHVGIPSSFAAASILSGADSRSRLAWAPPVSTTDSSTPLPQPDTPAWKHLPHLGRRRVSEPNVFTGLIRHNDQRIVW
jgi:hypothetical protein